jgi:hypothetical protein
MDEAATNRLTAVSAFLHEPIVAEVPDDLDFVAAAGLAMLPSPAWDQRRSGELTFDAPPGEEALEDLPAPDAS